GGAEWVAGRAASGAAEVVDDGPGVVADHLEGGVPVRGGRAQRIGVQGVLALDDLDPRLTGDRLGRLGGQGGLGEDRLDAGGLDLGDQGTEVAAAGRAWGARR